MDGCNLLFFVSHGDMPNFITLGNPFSFLIIPSLINGGDAIFEDLLKKYGRVRLNVMILLEMLSSKMENIHPLAGVEKEVEERERKGRCSTCTSLRQI